MHDAARLFGHQLIHALLVGSVLLRRLLERLQQRRGDLRGGRLRAARPADERAVHRLCVGRRDARPG